MTEPATGEPACLPRAMWRAILRPAWRLLQRQNAPARQVAIRYLFAVHLTTPLMTGDAEMVRTMFMALGLVVTLGWPSVGQETAAEQAPAPPTLLEQYIQSFSGRWVSEFVGDEDIEGYVSKGEKVRLETFNMATVDNSAVRMEWQLAKDGVVRGRSFSLLTWDPAAQVLRVLGSATGGFQAETTFTKDGDKWLQKSVLTFPDGSRATSSTTILLSADGKTQTVLITDRVDHTGQKLPDTTAVWQRVSRNYEALSKHLGWLVGDWETSKPAATVSVKWVAKDTVLSYDWTTPDAGGLSIIFWDSADEKIKMWGASSDGGNGQATLMVAGDTLTWNNVIHDPQGRAGAFEFSFVVKDESNFVLKFVNKDNGELTEIPLRRK
jgi:hypothetical protein